MFTAPPCQPLYKPIKENHQAVLYTSSSPGENAKHGSEHLEFTAIFEEKFSCVSFSRFSQIPDFVGPKWV
jgi:hypothetical protein